MTAFPTHRPKTDLSAGSARGGFSWVTLLTASSTWMAISRAFRAGGYPFHVPMAFPERHRRDQDAGPTSVGQLTDEAPAERSHMVEPHPTRT